MRSVLDSHSHSVDTFSHIQNNSLTEKQINFLQTGDLSTGLIANATSGFKNPNGCPIPATFFTMRAQTSCDYVKSAYNAGHEIAAHTLNHLAMGTDFKGSIADEIIGERQFLINNCSLPADDVVGHRSPYLINNPLHRQALQKGGFLYDSTINEHWPNSADMETGVTSPDGAHRLWPYSMDNGIPQNCAWTSNLCTPEEKYPGLFEVPVWVLQTDTYPNPAYAMDPCDGQSSTPCNTLSLLQSNYKLAYGGNKAPVPLYIHSPWLQNSTNMAATRAFIQWVTSTYPDAYFVTMHQLVQWMQNPVPKDQVGAWLGCVPGGQAAGAKNGVAAAIPPAAPVVPAPVAPVVPAAAVPQAAPIAPDTTVPQSPAVIAAQAQVDNKLNEPLSPIPAAPASKAIASLQVSLLGLFASMLLLL